MIEARLPGMTAAQECEIEHLLDAAGRGIGAAACVLGDLYRDGRVGLRHSPKQAFHWYARSALLGDSNGQNNLGACYQHGVGCRQSSASAVTWYRRASAQKLGIASGNLGYCYLLGQGVPVDKAEALAWFQTALAQGNEGAREMVDSLAGAIPPNVSFRDVEGRGTKLRLEDVTEEDEERRLIFICEEFGSVVVGTGNSGQSTEDAPDRS